MRLWSRDRLGPGLSTGGMMALRKVLLVAALAVALLVVADTATAGTLTIDNSAHRTGNGGEFLVTGYDTYYIAPHADVMQHEAGTSDFLTFCIEYSEHINLPGNYAYYTSFDAVGGGGGAVGGRDPVTAAMAKLFYAYWTAQLDDLVFTASNLTSIDFDYANATGDRASDGQQLQIALWSLAGEEAAGSPDPDAGGNELAAAFVEAANTWTWGDLGQTWSGIGGVRALNLYDVSTGTYRQSQLVIVPLPAGAKLGFALLAGLGIATMWRRRRRLSLG